MKIYLFLNIPNIFHLECSLKTSVSMISEQLEKELFVTDLMRPNLKIYFRKNNLLF